MFAKKMTIAGLACLLAVEASGCGNTGGGQVTSIRIGVSVYDQYDTFVSEMINHFNEYASEVSASMDSNVSVNIDVYNAAASQTTQNNQVKTMLEDGCDIICVNLVDRTEPVTIIDMAEKKDVPVIFFNRELVEQDLERWDKLYYVGAKAFESGIMQGEMAADIFKNDPAADKNGDGVVPVHCAGRRSRSSGCHLSDRVCCQYNYGSGRASGKAGLCHRKLEPCTGKYQNESASDGIRGSDRTGAV